jgi:nicotinate-nucleotide adenylyltransferase
MNVKSKNTGLFFGSFNPVHLGHLGIAGYLLDGEKLDEVWFVVSPKNPLKDDKMLANPLQRLEMVKLTTAQNPAFKTCDQEFSMPTPSYTIDTLKLLNEKYPERDFFLIIGSDNLEELHLWKDHEQILRDYKILVYPRGKTAINPFDQHSNVKITQAPLIDISSTLIREQLKDKKDVSEMLPANVLRYIIKNRLYGV